MYLALCFINLFLACSLAILELKGYREWKKHRWSWVKMAYVAVGLMWIVIYTYICYTEIIDTAPLAESGILPIYIIRPAITLTLAVLCSGIITKIKGVV